MFSPKEFAVLAVVACSVAVAGYSTISGHRQTPEIVPVNTRLQTGENTPAPGARSAGIPGRASKPVTRSAERSNSFALYANPQQGISFAYPRSYALEEGEIEEHSYFLKRQDELQPGAMLVATVLIPDDAYPNTTFEHGSLQLVASEGLSAESCKALATGKPGQFAVRSINLPSIAAAGNGAENVTFWWSEQKSALADTEIVERHYSRFANDTCYEFFSVVAVNRQSEPDHGVRPADSAKVLHRLEKILTSVRLYTPSTWNAPSSLETDPRL